MKHIYISHNAMVHHYYITGIALDGVLYFDAEIHFELEQVPIIPSLRFDSMDKATSFLKDFDELDVDDVSAIMDAYYQMTKEEYKVCQWMYEDEETSEETIIKYERTLYKIVKVLEDDFSLSPKIVRKIFDGFAFSIDSTIDEIEKKYKKEYPVVISREDLIDLINIENRMGNAENWSENVRNIWRIIEKMKQQIEL